MRLLWELNQLCPYKYNDIKTWFVYVGGVMSGRGAGSGVGKYLYNYCTIPRAQNIDDFFGASELDLTGLRLELSV